MGLAKYQHKVPMALDDPDYHEERRPIVIVDENDRSMLRF